jgi:hypothetical protein
MASLAVPEQTTPRRIRARASRPLAAVWLEREAFPVLVVAVCLIQLVRYFSFELAQDGWLALLGGQEVARHGLPHHNDLTVWSGGGRWVDQPWLAQLGFYGLYAGGGLKLVLGANTAMIIGAFALAIAAARSRGAGPIRVTAVAALSIPVLAFYWQVRSQSFAYLLFVAVLWLLVADSRSPSRRVLLVLPLLALWANLHGSVVLGATLVALYAVAGIAPRLRRRSGRLPLGRGLVLLLAPVLCIFASPYGFELAGYYRRTLFNPGMTRYIIEWQATKPGLSTATFFLLLLGGAWLTGRSRSLTGFERLAVLVTGVAALSSIRNVVWFGLAAVVLLPAALQEIWPERPARRRAGLNVGAAVVAVAGAIVAVSVISARPLAWLDHDWSPRAAAAVARVADDRPSARVFSTLRSADWLMLREPSLRGRVALDARVEILSQSDLHRFYDFNNRIGDRWRAAAAGYDLVVLDPENDGAIERALLSEPGTHRIYGDGAISVLSRPAQRRR